MAKNLSSPSPEVQLSGRPPRQPGPGVPADPPPPPSMAALPPIHDPDAAPSARVKPRPPRILVFNPKSAALYRVGDERWLGPRCVEQPLVGGLGGVLIRRDGIYDITGLVANEAGNGRIVLDLSMGYCTQRPVGSGRYLMAWDAVGHDGEIVGTVAGAKLFREFVARLVDVGTLPRLGETAIRKLLEDAQAHLHGYLASEHTPKADTVRTLEGDVAFIRAQLDDAIADGRVAPPVPEIAGFAAAATADPDAGTLDAVDYSRPAQTPTTPRPVSS